MIPKLIIEDEEIQSLERSEDEFALKIEHTKPINEKRVSGLSHHRNMSSEKIKKYKPLFRSPEPKKDKDEFEVHLTANKKQGESLRLPPIIQTEKRQANR